MTTISESAAALRSGQTTATDLAERALSALAAIDGQLGSFALVDRGGALAAAARADEELGAGMDRGPLHGVPVAVKDIIDMEGLPTRAGSPAYPDTARRADATAVTKLREAGAVIIGKTTSHELACGVYSEPAANPWDTERLPGGSSGGSGAAVAAGVVAMALGSDTGGSIRIPASVCGIAGLKPTYGLVSRTGVEPLSWSLDHLGPLAATVADCAATLEVIVGEDAGDPATSGVEPGDYRAALDRGIAGLRIGVLAGPPFAPMTTAVAGAFEAAIDVLEELGADLVPVEIDELRHTLAAEFAIVGPEAAHYHRRLLREQPELIDPGIRSLLVNGTLAPGGDYLKGLTARLLIRDAIRRTFEASQLDAVVTPTLPATAARRTQDEFDFEGESEPVTSAYVRTTAPFNLAGLPALSVPCGHDGGGLPIGLQIAGRPFAESAVLQIGAAYEAATTWSERRPPLHAEAA